MAEIKYTHKDAVHTINSYDNIISTYDWIKDALRAVFQDEDGLYIHCSIAFTVDEMSYDCDSIEEFKKYAFGKAIIPSRMLVYVSKDWVGSLMDVFAAYHKEADGQEFVLTAKDEMRVINLRDALRASKKPEPRKENVTVKIEDNSVHIGSNNQISNSVIGSKNTTEIEQETVIPENKEESLASKSFWQIIVPIVVGVIVVAICVAIGLN